MFKLIFARPEKKKTEPSVQAIVSEPEPIVVAEQSDDELVAIITAAVAAYIENEEPEMAACGFKVVSFRRTNGGRAWNSK